MSEILFQTAFCFGIVYVFELDYQDLNSRNRNILFWLSLQIYKESLMGSDYLKWHNMARPLSMNVVLLSRELMVILVTRCNLFLTSLILSFIFIFYVAIIYF